MAALVGSVLGLVFGIIGYAMKPEIGQESIVFLALLGLFLGACMDVDYGR